ncbi:trypsin-like serine protease [Streptomyces sp. TM32]|uniref:S1C family serine protease n=1 Tax=Streptomyces sp. TM32 TaxID=1652669 RepID=UPI001011DD1A|nr:trypsin-like peptidase domain-containing protein [Streptomyces sp. TM32]RXS85722.1 trypsin-like serine protease [Streptomyces sp. TM32]
MTESYRRSGDDTPQDRPSADGNHYASAYGYGYGSEYAQGAQDGAGQAVPPPPPYAPSSRRRTRRPVALIAAVALISGLIGGGSAALIADATNRATQNSASTPLVNAGNKPSGSGVSAVAKAVSPAIVEIKARTANGQSTGSGVVVTSNGEIVTNNHVVAGAHTVTVTFSDGSRKTAKVVGTDPDKDLAMVKISGAKNLTAAQLGDSDKIAVGDQVVAIGSPEGLTGSVTSGIVSALNRDVTVPKEESRGQQDNGGDGGWPFEFGGRQFNGDPGQSKTSYKAIQTDASLNPGNSGGALINMQGQIIGINSAMYAPSSGASGSSAGSIGLGFAIPINTVKADLDSLRGGGSGGSNSGV